MKKNHILPAVCIFTSAICLLISSIASAQSYQWAKKAGGSNSDDVQDVVRQSGANGNVFITGYFDSPTITFGSTTLNKSGSSSNMFVAKYDAMGNVVWAKNVGGTSYVRANALALTAPAAVYVAGGFAGSVTFGSTTLTSAGQTDIFIVKYDQNGTVLYATKIGGSGNDGNGGLDVKMSGSSGSTGFAITASFNSPSLTIGSTTLTYSGSGTDYFVAQFDSINCGNNFCWAKKISGNINVNDVHQSINNGDVVITGGFSGTVNFGATPLTSGGGGDIFIAKYNGQGGGALIWAKKEGGAGDESGTAIVMAPNTTDIYVAGNFGTTTYSVSPAPTTTIGSTMLTAIGPNGAGWYLSDLFLAKLDGVGNVLWAKGIHGIDQEWASDISSDFYKNVYFVGEFKSPNLFFGSDSITNAGSGSFDIFMAKCDPNGDFLWSKDIGGSSHEQLCSISEVWSDVAYIAGNFQSPSINFGNTTLTNSGSNDVFLTKLYSCNTVAPSICEVTVDSLSQYNVIIWDKTPYANSAVDSFIVYREVQSNVYKPLGAVPYDSLSMFVDTFRTKYFVSPYWSLGDPNAGTYRYKLQVHDTCGNYSALSPYHNTIFMYNTGGTFQWQQLYTIEGSPNPVTSYLLMRDNLNNGNWAVVNSVTGTQQSVTDPQYATYQSTANWRIETQWNISCTPTIIKNPDPLGTINTTRSNTFRINPSPVAVFTTSADTICVGGCVNFTDQSTNNPTGWAWTFSGGNPSSSIVQNPNNICYNTAGVYTITLTATNAGGSNSATKTITVQTCTGVNEILLENSLSVYPNPSNGNFILDLKEMNSKNVRIKMYDVFGRLVFEKTSQEKKTEIIPIAIGSNFAKGIYQLQIETDSGTVNKKIIIQ